MDRMAIVLLLCAAGCVPFRNRDGEPEPSTEPVRLCVRNETLGYGNITAHAGPVRFDVIPGEMVCRPVIDAGGGIQLTAVTGGGGAAGPLAYRNTLRPGVLRCWTWRLNNAAGSALDLEPCREGSESGSSGQRDS